MDADAELERGGIARNGRVTLTDPRDFRARQREIREEAILSATAELIGEVGYEAMSTDDVAARVGISKRTLYDHFPSKELLVVHVVTSGMEAVERAFNAVDPSLSAIDRLTEALRIAVRHRLTRWGWGTPLPRTTLERHEDYVLIRRRASARLAAWIDEGKRQGSIDAGLPTTLLVRLIMHWFSVDLSGIVQTSGLPEADVPDAIVQVVLAGVRA